MERLVTTSQAAEILGLSLQGIHYRIKKNQGERNKICRGRNKGRKADDNGES